LAGAALAGVGRRVEVPDLDEEAGFLVAVVLLERAAPVDEADFVLALRVGEEPRDAMAPNLAQGGRKPGIWPGRSDDLL